MYIQKAFLWYRYSSTLAIGTLKSSPEEVLFPCHHYKDAEFRHITHKVSRKMLEVTEAEHVAL